jgi:alkylresorcinol/alkylpyrone synthase
VLLVAVETTSLTFLHRDRSKSNLVATALFGDGAAAVLVAGNRTDHRGLEIMAAQCTLFPDSLDVMGWNFMDDGMQVVFSRDIPAIVRRNIRQDIRSFLFEQDLDIDRIGAWIAHPGGVKVIQAYQEALGISEEAMEGAREVLRQHGNMSSASVLFVLDWYLRHERPGTAEFGLMTSLGPGFSSDQVLLGWNSYTGDSDGK